MELIAKFAVTVSHVARSVKCNTETCWIEKKTHFLTPCRVGSTAPARSFPVRHTAAFTATFKQQMALIFTNRCSLPSADIAFILHFAFLLIFLFFLLLHLHQKELLLLLSVSDSTSLFSHYFLIHQTHARASALSHTSAVLFTLF